MASNNNPIPTVQISRSSTESSRRTTSLKSPRAPRFAEATAVHSPIEPSKEARNPFLDPPTTHFMPQPQPSDVGFGYINSTPSVSHQGVEMDDTDIVPKTPLKSALKSPGAPPRNLEELRSPTFKEEQMVEKTDKATEKEQRKDLKAKFRIRLAKIFLRGVNFSCALIVVSMLAATFQIFNATKRLPPRNGLPAWHPHTPIWPQVVLISIASCSLVAAIFVIITNYRQGHRRAEKVAVYYTTFALVFFFFNVIMWVVGAAILNSTKHNSQGSSLWGWSCKDGRRKELFENDIHYALVCRLQNWSLVCTIIEVVIESFTILVYGIVFYRYYTKRQLRKSMAVRDRARSDLYLAQLRSQSAPNTPGFGPLSPRDGGWIAPAGHPSYKDPHSAAEEGESTRYVVASPSTIAQPKPFVLQAAPSRSIATPKSDDHGFENVPLRTNTSTPPQAPMTPMLQTQTQQEHMHAAPGEQEYETVPIPGSHAHPTSPSVGLFSPKGYQSLPSATQEHGGFDFGLGNKR